MTARAIGGGLLAAARRGARLSQAELAARAGTSRTTLSAYEHGRKSPTLDTAVRILTSAGYQLATVVAPTPRKVDGPRGRSIVVLDPLPSLPITQALAAVDLPRSVNWSDPGRTYDLSRRHDRARAYEQLLQEGTAEDLLTYVDGALLVDLWDELVLPRWIRDAWSAAVEAATAG